MPGSSTSCFTSPSGNKSGSTSCGSGSASYDLRSGSCNADGSGSGECSGSTSVTAKDLYTLTASGSTPVTIVVNLHVAGSYSVGNCQYGTAGVQGTVTMIGGPSASVAGFQCSTSSVNNTVSMPITVTPGVSFELDTTLQIYAFWGGGYGGCQLSFASLPPGGVITSCQGFTTAPPVAVRSGSWGSLKLLYR